MGNKTNNRRRAIFSTSANSSKWRGEKKAEDSPKSSGIRKLVPGEKGTQDIVIFRDDDMSHMLDTGQHAHHQHYDGIRIEFACSF